MPTYKNITSESLVELYNAVKRQIDSQTGNDTPLSEIQAMVDRYLQRQVDRDDLLDDIDAQIDWINDEIDWIDTAIPQVPTATLAQLRTAVQRMLRENKRGFQQNRRMLKAWKWVIKNGKGL